LFAAMAALLAAAAAHRPLVVALEDLDSADVASLRLLEFLAGAPITAPLLLLATYRDTALGRAHPLAATLARLASARAVVPLRLTGLGEADVARLLALLGHAPAPATAASLARHCEGNPFFVCELMRLGREGDGDGRGSTRAPESVRELIGRRLDGLSGECNALLALASALGGVCESRALAALAELDGDRLAALVDEAVAARILVEVADDSGCLAFTHALIREVLYGELPAARRVLVHRRAAALLERRAQSISAVEVADLAHHTLAAARAGADAARAVHCCRKAAEVALSQLAYEDAVAYYEAALAALDLAGDSAEAARGDLLSGLAEAEARARSVEALREG
jgi:predicted ATPase